MKGELLALAAMAMFASNILLTRAAATRLATSTGYPIVVVVNIVFGAIALAVQQALRSTPLEWHAWGFVWFVLAGVFSTYLGRWFNMESIVRLGPAKSSAFQISSPLFTFVFALMFLGDRLSIGAIIGMLISAAGLLMLSLATVPARSRDRSAPAAVDSRGRVERLAGGMRTLAASSVAIALGSAIAYAIGNVLRGAAVRLWNEPVAGALIGAVTGLVLHFVFSKGHGATIRGLGQANRAGVVLYVASGVLTIMAQICLIVGMVYAPVAIVALITLATPLIVFPVSYYALGNDEGINARTIAGALLTGVGIAILVLR